MVSYTQTQSLTQTKPVSRVATAPIMMQSQRSIQLSAHFKNNIPEALNNNNVQQGGNS